MTHQTVRMLAFLIAISTAATLAARDAEVPLLTAEEIVQILPKEIEGFELEEPRSFRHGVGRQGTSMASVTGKEKLEEDEEKADEVGDGLKARPQLTLTIIDTGFGGRWEALKALQDMTLEVDHIAIKTVKIKGEDAMKTVDKNEKSVSYSMTVNGFLVTASMTNTEDPASLRKAVEALDWDRLKKGR